MRSGLFYCHCYDLIQFDRFEMLAFGMSSDGVLFMESEAIAFNNESFCVVFIAFAIALRGNFVFYLFSNHFLLISCSAQHVQFSRFRHALKHSIGRMCCTPWCVLRKNACNQCCFCKWKPRWSLCVFATPLRHFGRFLHDVRRLCACGRIGMVREEWRQQQPTGSSD